MPIDASRRTLARERAALAQTQLKACRLCPRNCGVNRLAGEVGYCGASARPGCFRTVLQTAEEAKLKPSYQVYFSGCNMRCEFCSVAEWNREPASAQPADWDALAEQVRQQFEQGAATLNLLGGEPSVHVAGLLEFLARVEVPIQVVWNTNLYCHPVVLELVCELVDYYLADFKCGNDRCADALLDTPDYCRVVTENLKRLPGTGLIVRYLVLPGHRQCCLEPILAWIKTHRPDAVVSLWPYYAPPPQPCRSPAGYLNPDEYRQAVALAREMGLQVSQ